MCMARTASTWPANDALCAALQIINHLQDCQAGLPQSRSRLCSARCFRGGRRRGRGLGREPAARRPLRACLHNLARTHRSACSTRARRSPRQIDDFRLAMEVSVIHTLARRLVGDAQRARSAERARAPARLGRRRARRSSASRRRCGASRRRVPVAIPQNPRRCVRRAWTPTSPAQSRARSAPPAARSTPRCASCRGRSARRCSRSTASAARVDDIADSTGPRPQRLAAARRNGATDIDALYDGDARCRASTGLARPVREFDLAREDFLAVIDGMEMDALADIRAPTFATLDLYCDRVASAVGRLSVRVFGMEREDRHAARASSRPRAAAHQHPARPRRGRRARPALSAARGAAAGRHRHHRSGHGAGAARARRRPAPRSSTRARMHFAEADTIMAARRAARCARRASWATSIASILDRLVARGFGAAARRRCACRARAARLASCCATRSFDAAHDPHHRRRPRRPFRRGRPHRARRKRRRARGDQLSPAGAAAPITMPRSA